MDIVPATYVENIKRYLRRRKYQQLDNPKKRLKTTRLGSKTRHWSWKIRRPVPKLRFKTVSPIKLMAKLHDAYVDMMIRLVGDNNVGIFRAKRVPKGRSPAPMVAANDEVVDGRLVLEIYKRLVSSRELEDLSV
ncbi:hypothetical protein LOK49_LG03G00865 [Camellia lanceoleosa]|uniref:Uncharacterized protein n=1 Tax=Camellia lanceoleosa TaxID=1840588 RepID=A0ACC0IFJ4_9ERIC|nr:hypothetical protein LOK49_LG03G00865 [Camellia lanceoleosa]